MCESKEHAQALDGQKGCGYMYYSLRILIASYEKLLICNQKNLAIKIQPTVSDTDVM